MSRVIIVANRLPVVANRRDGKLTFDRSSGGLVSGLSGLRGRPMLWVGWPGSVVDEDRAETERLLPEMGFHPVFLSLELSEQFYEGYCNGAIWPLFHSMPTNSKTVDEEYKAFLEATSLFADEVAKVYKEGDIIWIQDYHLLMLPTELKKRLGNKITMSLFLHIPFPHVDVLRLLPNHTALIASMLQVDLIGFHTTEYTNNFIGCINRLHGISPVLGRAMVPAIPPLLHPHLIQISTFPMGIDFAKHFAASKDQSVIDRAAAVRRHLGTEKVVFSVSRLDYTKGVPESLRAMYDFFRENPEWVGRLVFVLVVVPSRTRVEKYAELKRQIDRMVGEINGEFCTPVWSPIVYMYRSFGWTDLMALYLAADIGLVIPLRDGMNLCAKEYVAVHADSPGILILSILAGAAKEMIESIIVNPNSTESVIKGIKQALVTPPEDQISRNSSMAQRLEQHDIVYWTESIFKQLDEVKEAQKALEVCILDDYIRRKMLEDFNRGMQKLIVLDYDGTLVPFFNDPADAKPDDELLKILSDLSHLKNTTVLVLSGRDRNTLGSWLGHLPIEMAAEHGAWSWSRSKGMWENTVRMGLDQKWKSAMGKIMEDTTMLLPGSFIEEKEFSLVFHYRACSDPNSTGTVPLERKKINDVVLSLKTTLLAAATGLPIRIVDAKEAVEVRTLGTSKGDHYLTFSQSMNPAPDFVLALGDDTTDEDVFEAMQYGYSVRVGFYPSHAHHNISDFSEVRALLRAIVQHATTCPSNGLPNRISFSI